MMQFLSNFNINEIFVSVKFNFILLYAIIFYNGNLIFFFSDLLIIAPGVGHRGGCRGGRGTSTTAGGHDTSTTAHDHCISDMSKGECGGSTASMGRSATAT